MTKLKTMGSWGIALSVSRIVKVILQDKKECMPVSTYIKVGNCNYVCIVSAVSGGKNLTSGAGRKKAEEAVEQVN